ncbi:uncharacterized protein SPSK_10591 [Sporothrix schenckii 1099-18]|uniref:FAD/NAD(P)-binding domain-containing protein n=1 Tax=Sporothrix schenckii 1099-18 TaxID=1397361 RepID=A0A0F2LZM3_SPOSC|nr:uncharacterized protein SPSK_10591 [Sporothrix schenckii 1099-18]KJR82913.1 hypothetical protein SPSK_10591 [Sporothrix schenckii 1099-18]
MAQGRLATCTVDYSTPAIKDTCPVRVICAGAGFSGVCAAIRLPQHIPNLDLVITATGFDTSYLPRYPVVGRGGVSLEQM